MVNDHGQNMRTGMQALLALDALTGDGGAFSSDWVLTDVFAGFEMWTGSDGVGLKADQFTFLLNNQLRGGYGGIEPMPMA